MGHQGAAQAVSPGADPEYWLIDGRRDLSFQILQYHTEEYEAVAPVKGWLRSPLFGKFFRLERRRARLGLWEFELRVKSRV